ncbi:SDR family oxidoreductase [Streptomyces fractus]|uniref:SDR family oxidoreductase n=1 Tax=Streptomyces fractus TaxID=641806 RepID=UPI003CEEA3E9
MSKNVLITGAASGFGETLVHAYAGAGWNVTATMRDTAKAPAAFAELDSVLVERLDITDEASIRSALAASEDRFGPLDVLVNNAAYALSGTLEETSIDQIRRLYETNVFGTLAVTKAVLPGMRERGTGHILTFSSAGGLVVMPSLPAYSSSKSAIEGYFEALAFDLTHLGVKVTIVEPGVFETQLPTKGDVPEQRIDAYAPAAEALPDMFDFTPGNLKAASEAVVEISDADKAPMRLYVGHGLDSVRRRYQDHLDQWAEQEHLTRRTL